MLHRLAVFLGLALVIGAASACGKQSDARTVVRFWAMGREGEVVRQLVPDFERTHPGIHIEVQQLPWTAAHQKLLTAYAGGSLPDVAQLGNTWLPEFVALHAVDAVPHGLVDATDYFPGIWQTNVIGNTAWGVPWYVDTRLLFYNRELLAEAGFEHPPATWNEWFAMLCAIKERSGRDRFGALLPLNEYEPLIVLGLQQKAPLLRDDNSRGNFQSEGFVRALSFYRSLFQSGYAPATGANQIANVWDEFARGYFVFYISGPWNIGEFKRRLPERMQSAWITAPMPAPDSSADHAPGASVAGGASLVVFSHSEAKPQAWAFVEFLSRPDVALRFHALTGDLPARRSAWADASLTSDPYAKAFHEQLEHVKPAPSVPEWERIATEMQTVAERLVHDPSVTVEEAAAEIDKRADRILEKRRWLLARKEQP